MSYFIELLRRKRNLLLKAYIIHVGWFASTCAFAATDSSDVGLSTSLWLALLLTPFESGLFLPARNLLEARRILRAWDRNRAPPDRREIDRQSS